ncbi:MAG: hypothetical protein AB7I37_18030 [Pirellulales bacterium]
MSEEFKKLEVFFRVTDASIEEVAAIQQGEQPPPAEVAEPPKTLPEAEQDLLAGMMAKLAEANLKWSTPKIFRRFESLLQAGKIDRQWMINLVGGEMDRFRAGVQFMMEEEDE